jgi:tripartite-type tricarboxylate transporter receptor subunit TctC
MGAVQAQEIYPARPVRLVVGVGAGGPTDIPARFVAEKLGEGLGQRVIVENKPAAAGMIATRDVLAQPRDGYTLLLCTHFEAINSAVYRNAQFKLDDLAPTRSRKILLRSCARELSSAVDLAAFVRYAKSHPASCYARSPARRRDPRAATRRSPASATVFRSAAALRSCRSWLPAVISCLLTSRSPQYEAGQLKILAVSAPERRRSDAVPTLRERRIRAVRLAGICAGAGRRTDHRLLRHTLISSLCRNIAA